MEYEVWTDGSCIKDDERDSKGECGAGYVIVENAAVELALEDLVARNLGPSVHI